MNHTASTLIELQIKNPDIWEEQGIIHLYPDAWDEDGEARKKKNRGTPERLAEIIANICVKTDGRLFFTDEYKFNPVREWRADYAVWRHGEPRPFLLVEFEGGTWMTNGQGRSIGHSHPSRYEQDCEKYNAASAEGFVLLRFTGKMVKDGRAELTLLAVLTEEWDK